MACYLLFLDYVVVTFQKEWNCRNGGVDINGICTALVFQPLAECGGNSITLILVVDIQMVKMPLRGDVSKAENQFFLYSDICQMTAERGVPLAYVCLFWSPGIQLFLGIVFCVHRMDGVMEYSCYLWQVGV